MRSYTLTFDGSATPQRVPDGWLFKIQTLTSPVDVTFFKNRHAVHGVIEGVRSGFKRTGLAPGDRFDYVEIVSSTAQTVVVIVGDADVGDDSITGSIDIEPSDTVADAADVSVGATATALVASSTTRKRVHLALDNAATVNVRVGGATVTASRGLQLQAGVILSLDTRAALYAIREGAGTATISILTET